MSTSRKLLSQADSLTIDEDYESALNLYTLALSKSSTTQQQNEQTPTTTKSEPFLRFRILSHRSSILLLLKRPLEALDDARVALSTLEEEEQQQEEHSTDNTNNEEENQNNHPSMIELEACHYRIGRAAYELNRFVEAKEGFDQAMELAVSMGKTELVEKCVLWLEKCDEAMDHPPTPPAPAETETEAAAVAKSPPESKVTTTTTASKPKPSSKPSSKPAAAASMSSSTAAAATSSVSSKKKTSSSDMPKYQYYQSDTILTIAILEPNIQPSHLQVDIGLDTLTVILTKNGQPYTIICGTLFDAVDVHRCKVKYMDEKVLIKLRKREKRDWNELLGQGLQDQDKKKTTKSLAKKTTEDSLESTKTDSTDEQNPSKTDEDDTTVIPKVKDPEKPRPYSSHRDWDAIERSIKQQEESEKPEGDEALNKLFRDIYGKANEDTRRAMVKSMQTSGGTVLSTNWDEVKKTDYEKKREAPKGMEWRNWEGQRLEQKD